MELAQDIILSNAYLRANQLLLLLAYLTGFGALFFSIALIQWTERANSAATTAPWPLIVGTWRDSLLITLLYISEGMFYRVSAYAGAITGRGEIGGESLLAWVGPMLVEPFGFLALLFAALIAGRRILILSRWLRAQS